MVRRVCKSTGFVGRSSRLVLLLSGLFLLASCKHDKPQKLAPLEATSWLIDLDVPGFGKAALAVPLGATAPRPIVIALHGSADRPEWACSALRAIAGPQPFVLCPRGVQRADFAAPDVRYTFGTSDEAAAELRAALTELKRRFGQHVARGPVVFVGFEIGADHVAAIARQEPSFFSRLLLIEPEPRSWPSSQSALFGHEGGQRVLFACGPAHRGEFEQRAVLTGRGGAEARAIFLGERPPALDGAARALIAKQWRWLAAPAVKPATLENIAGNALPAGGPVTGRPAP